ncbi:uncharacterized protein LOC101846099 [Aplysia californica]|uniref:acylglycerol lipase n=1 Tax=Aplysia californica TaxID=6500 RepID=A0ABM0K5S2_APLCA|nr:uncharacterized protein LOC101846099 [Aplysia californica]
MTQSDAVRERKSKSKGKSRKSRDEKPEEENDKAEGGRKPDVDCDENSVGNDKSSTEPTEQRKSKRQRNKGKGNGEKESYTLLSAACGKLKYVFLIIFVPPFLNYASLQRETVELRPPGELYDIGWGQKLFLSCQGQGPPTVVLDAPTGMSSDVWTAVVEKLSQHANVCVYDRAGIGFSERPINRSGTTAKTEDSPQFTQSHDADRWQPFTVERMVDDLSHLISSSSQQPKPLILVGAELGAVVAQFFAHIYEADTLGLVLVNPLPDGIFEQTDGAWSHHWFNSVSPTYQTFQLGAALGFTRLGLLIGALNQPITGQYVPEEVIIRQKHLLCHPRHLSSVVDEHYFINETLSQLRTLRMVKPLANNISVSILTGNYYDEQMPAHLNKAWARAEQLLLSKYFPHAQHLVVNGADRHIMYRKPEPIIEAVTRLIRRWKKSQTLKGSKSS